MKNILNILFATRQKKLVAEQAFLNFFNACKAR
jgi:hypothetical protein